MQEDWKMEIEAMFDDIRVKEKVRRCFFSSFSFVQTVNSGNRAASGW